MSIESISPAARRYLRAWAVTGPLADIPANDPRHTRVQMIALPSTVEQCELEAHFVAALTYGQAAQQASTREVAAELRALGVPHLLALDAAGERDRAREAVHIIQSTEHVEALMRGLTTAAP